MGAKRGEPNRFLPGRAADPAAEGRRSRLAGSVRRRLTPSTGTSLAGLGHAVRARVAGARPSRLSALVLAAGLLVTAGCATTSGGSDSAPPASPEADGDTLAVEEVRDDTLRAVARAEGLDEEELLDAAREADRAVDELDVAARREFRRMFGVDPLGLTRRPDNAGRYHIPLETNDAVERWIHRFSYDIPDRFALYLQRAGQFEPMIRAELREAGLPEDLVYKALIESGMTPRAFSRARAVGLWQFIAPTARRYDLEVSYWVDERRDPLKSTRAAIAYLSDLYDEFGSWYLAAAAYNVGENRVRRGIRRTGSNDFWQLSAARVIPLETRNHVPKLIAAAIIAQNPERYGFGHVVPDPPMRYDRVEVPDATSLDVVAGAAGVNEDVIRELNPQFRRNVTPPNRTSTVRVPQGHGERFAAAYAEIPPSERVTWHVHTVTRGQTLSHIAARYGSSVSAIRAANDGLNPRRLQIGQRVVVPRSPGGGQGRGLAERPASGPTTVVVQRGDTLWHIARRHGVSTRELMAWNGLNSSVIRPGERIHIRR